MNDNGLTKLETFNKYNKNIDFICDDAKNIIEEYKNKDRESKQIMENLPNMNNIDIIIEPYCGSFSLIRNLILLYPDKKYIYMC